MKNLLLAGVAVALIAISPVRGDITYKPIDTNKLVVKPTNAAANIAAQTIGLVGQTTAGSLEKNGYVKTINNIFSKKIHIPTAQSGRSGLPMPNLFPSTQYKSYNSPGTPINMPRR
jgi:hypothetical protein